MLGTKIIWYQKKKKGFEEKNLTGSWDESFGCFLLNVHSAPGDMVVFLAWLNSEEQKQLNMLVCGD